MAPSRTLVLVADDHHSVIEALRLLIEGEGYEVVAVASGEALLNELRSRRFGLAIVDLNYRSDTTSGREGLRLIESIHKVAPTLPVIAMTGWSSPAGRAEALRRGAVEYIEKPWDNDHLLAVVTHHLVSRP